MRGLEARLCLAHYRVSAAVGLAEDAADQLAFAVEVARIDGYYDADHGVTDMPAFFRDEPMLQDAWKVGQMNYRAVMEMDDCWHCEHSGNPCPSHG